MTTTTPAELLHHHRGKYFAAVLAIASAYFVFHIGPRSTSFGSDSYVLYRPLEADGIIQRAYQQTFGALSINRLCSPDISGRACIDSLLSETEELSASWDEQQIMNLTSTTLFTPATTTNSFPWWFITMLRDINAKGSGMHAGWHNLTMMDPAIDYCTIEKVATTQWRNVQCILNHGSDPVESPRPCQLNKSILEARSVKNVSRVVMLRDPLERFLSGYLDKCATDWRRRIEGHCEPNEVFKNSDLTQQIKQDRKQLFAAYVDAMPFKWDLHFFPQSMYCDGLFRHVDAYDFVGHMDKDFYNELKHLIARSGEGNKLPDALEKVFHLSDELEVHQHSNLGKETQAAMHVKEYYTAASVRRALEYFAVDYARLGLEVPHWVHALLEEE